MSGEPTLSGLGAAPTVPGPAHRTWGGTVQEQGTPAPKILTVDERVQAGAALLDARDPGWAQRLPRLSRLAQGAGSGANCVLGQLYGHVWSGPGRLGIRVVDMEAYGFAEWERGQVGQCNAAWRREILERRA